MELTVKDAAKLLNVSEKLIRRWVKEQVIPVHRINDQLRFHRAELLEWATSRRMQISPGMFSDAGNGLATLPRISESLKAGGIVYRLGGDDKSSVLRAVVEVLPLPDEVDREFLFHVLLAREALGSTGIGDGIAIPHVRNPIVLHVKEPTITLCFLEHPIHFDSIDSQPVDTLFTLISPTVRTHHHLLSQLGFVLQNLEFRAALKRRAPHDELMEALARAEGAIPRTNESESKEATSNGNARVK